jgi:hypothetical protein
MRERKQRRLRASNLAPVASLVLAAVCAHSQSTTPQAAPIAIVPIDSSAKPGDAPTVTGALEVTAGRTMIAASGSVTAGSRTARVVLPRRGELHICAHTTVKLAADGTAQGDAAQGLLLALDHGALELSLAGSGATRAADVLMTPDFKILVSGPGAAEVKVRLGVQGDTCIENSGSNAPYVLVSSIFEGGAYRVQAGQRVSFQHGSLHEVVDAEKEPCGCPPEARGPNDFPLAQSEGLEPLPPAAPSGHGTILVEPLEREGSDKAAKPTPPTPAEQSKPAQPARKPGFFARMGAFFRKVFGAE